MRPGVLAILALIGALGGAGDVKAGGCYPVYYQNYYQTFHNRFIYESVSFVYDYPEVPYIVVPLTDPTIVVPSLSNAAVVGDGGVQPQQYAAPAVVPATAVPAVVVIIPVAQVYLITYRPIVRVRITR